MKLQARMEKIGSLDCIVVPGTSHKAIFMLHGYGADMQDLAPLSGHLDPEQNLNWYFPNAPLEITLAPGMSGRAWFQIDVAALEAAMLTGTYRDLTQTRPSGIDHAVQLASEVYFVLKDQYLKVALGGFSQGAMTVTDLSFNTSEKPDALVLLSGTILNQEGWKQKAPSCKGLAFFQSHGTTDPLLNYKHAQILEQLLKEAGLKGHLESFSGGHEIPLSILEKLKTFLERELL